MRKGAGRKPLAPEDEIRALESAAALLGDAVERMREANRIVDEVLGEATERVAMPNPRRAEQQIRTAVNAAEGARASLDRRIDLRRGVLAPAPRRTAPPKKK